MKTQHYKIKATTDNIEKVKPGGFVYESNEDSAPIGFIDFVNVNDCEIGFMLFEPIEKLDFMINIAERCDYKLRLKELLESDKDIARNWAEHI